MAESARSQDTPPPATSSQPSQPQPVTIIKSVDEERWAAHEALHAAAETVAVKAAADVKEALDRAAVEVTGRLNEVRATITQVLGSHADLHTADHEAMILAREGVARELHNMNNIRADAIAQSAMYMTGDMVRALLQAQKVEQTASMTAALVEMKASMTTGFDQSRTERVGLKADEDDAEKRLAKLENAMEKVPDIERVSRIENRLANLDGKLVAAVGITIFVVGLFEFMVRVWHP